MVTITTSPLRAASFAVTAFAPVSAAKSRSVSGPRELATKTLCPSAVRRRVNVPPICPCSNDSDVHRCSFPGDVWVSRTKSLLEQIQERCNRFPVVLLSRNALPIASAANTSAWRIWTNVQELELLALFAGNTDATEYRKSMLQ